jgi:hypothetical protein
MDLYVVVAVVVLSCFSVRKVVLSNKYHTFILTTIVELGPDGS